MKDKFQNAAREIRLRIGQFPVFATWTDENGKETFRTELTKAEAVEKEDGWHLLGWDKDNKEYCIGGATVISIFGDSTLVLYKP
jgi:hypothetical protein